MRPNQFCNLTEGVLRSTDSLEDIKRKVRIASFIGTLQSTLTDFVYLSDEWKKNTEEERLLGVSLTGICDHPILNGSFKYEHDLTKWLNDPYHKGGLGSILSELRDLAVRTNAEYSSHLGIANSAAVTCVKPSGTVSQLVDSASGIHARYAPYYLRAVRADVKDPMAKFMIDAGFPHEKDKMNPSAYVFYFPMKAPEGSLITSQMAAKDQMDLWFTYQEYWCEHKPSVTISYTDSEFLELGQYVYNNFDKISGVSFLPFDGHVYEQAPYTPITKEAYEAAVELMPKNVDWSQLRNYETDGDETEGVQQLACVAGICEI